MRTPNSPIWITKWKTNDHDTVCLGNEQLLVPSSCKAMFIFKIWRKSGWILCRRSGFGKVGIPWKLLYSLNFQPSTLISPAGSSASISKVSGGHQLFNSLTERIFSYSLRSGKIRIFGRWIPLQNVNDNLQWSKPCIITATILYWKERDIRVHQNIKGSIPFKVKNDIGPFDCGI